MKKIIYLCLITLVPSLPIISANNDHKKKVCFATFGFRHGNGKDQHYFLTEKAIHHLQGRKSKNLEQPKTDFAWPYTSLMILSFKSTLLDGDNLNNIGDDHFYTKQELNDLFNDEKYKDEKKQEELNYIEKEAKKAWEADQIMYIDKDENKFKTTTHAQYFDGILQENIDKEQKNNKSPKENQDKDQKDKNQQNKDNRSTDSKDKPQYPYGLIIGLSIAILAIVTIAILQQNKKSYQKRK